MEADIDWETAVDFDFLVFYSYNQVYNSRDLLLDYFHYLCFACVSSYFSCVYLSIRFLCTIVPIHKKKSM